MAQEHFKTPPGPKRVLKSATVSQHLQGWLRTQRMVKDTTDGEGHNEGHNGWLRIKQVVKDTIDRDPKYVFHFPKCSKHFVMVVPISGSFSNPSWSHLGPFQPICSDKLPTIWARQISILNTLIFISDLHPSHRIPYKETLRDQCQT